jgi:iron only hydrogenase large subunit-like protein
MNLKTHGDHTPLGAYIMNTLSPVYTEQTECQDCYKCIRRCPVKAIRVENGHAAVMGELCIACGRCVINCPAHAKRFRDDTAKTKQLLTIKKRVIVSLAPSFAAEFPEFTPEEFAASLKKLGFSDVSETALGADLVSASVAAQLEKSLKDGKQKLFLSSACPAVVEFIKRYMSDYTPFITDCASPLLAHARYLHKLYGKDIGVVFIGPCIAKKRESDVWKEIDSALTYKELRAWFDEYGITPNSASATGHAGSAASSHTSASSKTAASKKTLSPFIPRRAAKGELFPVDGGMIAACKKYSKLSEVRTISVSGIEAIRETLTGLNVKELKEPLFLELLSCVGGCINGPGTLRESSMAMKRVQTLEYAEKADDKIDSETLEKKPVMTGTLPADAAPTQKHSEEQIRTALRSVGKYSGADEINCGGCGYDSCRAFAQAMLDGVAEKTMCVSYMRNLAQKKANGLIAAIPSGVVIADKNMQIVECNKNFAALMGSEISGMYEAKPGLEGADLVKITVNAQFFADVLAMDGPDVIEREVHEGKKILHYTVFAIEKEEIAAGVIEDITAPQNQKNRTISQAKKVIAKNLSVVQKIAFLLGENAAETESILNSIIDSYNDGGEDT